MDQKSLKILSYAVKIGIFILPACFLITSSLFFFPFITGKNFFFRIVIEILFLLWVVLAAFDADYRPKKSPVIFALAATLLILSLATIFGENPYRSFWSNFERMEGLIGHIHLFLYFLITVSVLRFKNDWLWLFRSIITFGAFVVLYAYGQLFGFFNIHQGAERLDSTLGNATYLAIFVIFQIFILGFLLVKSSGLKMKLAYAALLVINLPILYYTATRGAILGFIFGIVTLGIIIGLLSKNKKIHLSVLGAMIAMIAIIALFLVFRNSDFVLKSPVLNRFSSISFKEKTVESRFLIWKMSLEGFKEHPLLGWGPENYNLLFNKYYNPKLWGQEQWFDRAHNVFFDWLINAGVLGLLAYLSIFVSAIYTVLTLYKKEKINSSELALFIYLFIAYGFHNLFVFDNLTSYFLFFSILGYIHYKYTEELPIKKEKENKKYEDADIYQYLIITLAFSAVLFSLYSVNLKPMLSAKDLLDALRYAGAEKNVDVVLESFDKVISLNTFGSTEAVDQLSDYANKVNDSDAFSKEDKIKILNAATDKLEDQIKKSPEDLRYYLFAGALYGKSGRMEESIEKLVKAREIAPFKQSVYFALADTYAKAGKTEEAFSAAETAYNLDRDYGEAVRNLAIMAAIAKKQEYVNNLLLEYYGGRDIPSTMMATAYFMVGNLEKVKDTWLALVDSDPSNAQYHVSLAASYMALDMNKEAIAEIEKAIELKPEFKQQGEYYIKEIKAGRKP